MNLFMSTLLYMFIATILMIVANYLFIKTNFLNYSALLDTRDKIFVYFTVSSFLYLIYIVAFIEFILPLYILAIILCSGWLYFLVFDIELKVMPIKNRVIITIITITSITLIWLGVNYIQGVN